ncbi:pre-RNA processing PIH1/Nop17-domain-containing protein [Lentinula aciculospora]|uniref:Pre-RNA processing PIH1/Nop17-domain-containing protein n=1 Tax=Lentinula aciculospora TaxID=153920 RepID=A0A9W9AFW3_9AGAR|nr:pre-RNA processing PIH1/Nop17-domain-containing protein [Lentinula aciculospora]
MLSVSLQPVAGFCVKTNTLQSSSYIPLSLKQSFKPQPTSTPIPQGCKVFVNVAWDANVPPPPDGNEDAIQRAMNGDELDKGNLDDWFVPVIVSEGRFDTDKAGKPSLVFDCVYHNSVKSRTLRDPEFKVFIIELSIQRIEAQTQLTLSRQIGTPNIAVKGKLQPRTVSIPSFLARPEAKAADAHNLDTKSGSMRKPLIEEIIAQDSSDTTSQAGVDVRKPKSILKIPLSGPAPMAPDRTKTGLPLTWSWHTADDDRLHVQIEVPLVEKTIISRSTLDIEPRRLIFSIPDHPVLDLNLSLSDAELVAYLGQGSIDITNLSNSSKGKGDSAVNKLLALKRQRPFNVDSATAEWFVVDNTLLISV